MADILNVGSSALLSLQRAINTTGHNIANVNTDGYSRQRVNFDTLPPQLSGGSYIGSGVTIDSVQRVYDQYLTSEVRTRTSSQAGFDAFRQLTSRIDGLLADPAVGLAPALDNFFTAVQSVADNPASLPERQVLIGQAQVLADRFHYLDSNFKDTGEQMNARIEASVLDINSLAKNIADLNRQITRATAAAGGQQPNDLLDTRDQLINELSQRIGVATTTQSDGAINIMVGNGQPLVVGVTANQLQTFPDPLDGTRTLVGTAGAGGFTDISRFLSGGELGAVVDFREQVLDPAISKLGLLASGLSATFNDQHQLGLDLQGQPGAVFFKPLDAATAVSPSNTGSGAINATITNAQALTGDNYSVRYDGSQYVLTNLTTQATQTGAGPFVVDGVTVTLSGAPSSGDTFLVQPTAQGAALFALALNRPEQIAAATPVRSQTPLTNTGAADISNLAVTGTTGLPLSGPITLSFNPNALGAGVPGYDVTGIAGGPLAYNPATDSSGKTFSLGDVAFTVSGVPASGDSFVVENNTGGSGDNRNALGLAALQDAKQLLGGSATYQNIYGSLVADIGVKTRQADSAANAEQVMLDQAVAARDSTSGVNLDEEAANLIRFQQAYQAAAQVIAVADQIFQTLINATQR